MVTIKSKIIQTFIIITRNKILCHYETNNNNRFIKDTKLNEIKIKNLISNYNFIKW